MKSLITSISLLIGSIMLIGCLSAITSGTMPVRVDEGMKYEPKINQESGRVTHKWVLPERRSINRIEIHFDPIEPLKNLTVYAQYGEKNWRAIKEVKTPIRTSPYVIRYVLSTDAIRITQETIFGGIRTIELYGTAPKAPKFEGVE